jgi:hypothetical protein
VRRGPGEIQVHEPIAFSAQSAVLRPTIAAPINESVLKTFVRILRIPGRDNCLRFERETSRRTSSRHHSGQPGVGESFIRAPHAVTRVPAFSASLEPPARRVYDDRAQDAPHQLQAA